MRQLPACRCQESAYPGQGRRASLTGHSYDTQHLILDSPLSLFTRARTESRMSLVRTARLITAPRARLQIIPNITAARVQQQRTLSSTTALRAGDSHAHEDHYDSPSGWLWGVKPGEKYENEGWENVWYYGFFGSLLFGLVGYCYKPDTR